MNTSTRPRECGRALSCLALLGALTALSGCLNLSPEKELAEAAGLVQLRSGVRVGGAFDPEAPPVSVDRRALSAEDAVRLALHSHPQITMLVEAITAARADLVQSSLLPNPVVNVMYGFATDGGGGSPMLATLMQQLVWLWERPAKMRAAEADLRRQVLEVSDRALTLVARTRSAHARLVHAEQAVAREEALVAVLERGLSLFQARFDQGEATEREVNGAELRLLVARDRQIQSRANLEVRRRELLELFGDSLADAALRTDGKIFRASESAEAIEERNVIHLAVLQRLDVGAAYAGIRGHSARVRLAQLGRLPEVSGGAAFQRNFENRDGVFPSVQVEPKIFDSGAAAVAKAEAIERRSLAEADGLLAQAVLEARQGWVAWRSTVERHRQLTLETVPLAAENLALARLEFEAGTANLLDVLEDERAELLALRDLDDLTLELALRWFELERAVGGSLRASAPEEISWIEEESP